MSEALRFIPSTVRNEQKERRELYLSLIQKQIEEEAEEG
jgi:hypothetical protein